MKAFCKFIIILYCVSTCKSFLLADATFPYSIDYFDFYEDGKLFLAQASEEEPTFYFIKTNWQSDLKTIYYWQGYTRKNINAKSFNSHIFDATTYQNYLLLLAKDNNDIIVSIFDKSSESSYKKTIDSNLNLYPRNINIRWLESSIKNSLFFLIDKKLYKLTIYSKQNFEIKHIADNVISAKVLQNSKNSLAFVEKNTENGILYTINIDNIEDKKFIARTNLLGNIELKEIQNYLVIINASETRNSSLLQFVDMANKSIINSIWLQANLNYIDFTPSDNHLYTLIMEKSGYKLLKIALTELNKPENWQYISLPNDLFRAKKIKILNGKLFLFFENSIAFLNKNLSIELLDYFNFNEYLTADFDIIYTNNYLILSSKNECLILTIKENMFWFLNRQIQNTGNSIAYIILIIIILVLYRRHRRQAILLNTLLDLPSSGFVFLINRTGKLVRANEDGRNILGISPQVILKKQFSYYFKNERTKVLAEIIEKGLTSRISFQQKVNIVQENINKEWFCSLIPLRTITGRFSGVVLTGVDITKELEKKTMTNWAQLAHDMQTNLSTIRLNAEQIESDNENNIQRKNKIIYQAKILMQRVRDIVTVGRDDKLDRVTVNSVNFCNEIRQEFDDELFEDIEFILEVEDFNFICDKPKLLRCVRNAVENGIKAMKNKNSGYITIACHRDIHNIYIAIKDTGEGMDKATQEKIATPFFSTGRNEGGSGIGMMIMKRVAEIHGGKIIINSIKNEGTEVIIQFPDMLRRKKIDT